LLQGETRLVASGRNANSALPKARTSVPLAPERDPDYIVHFMKPRNWGVLLLAHGTVNDPSELPEFLSRIRRGRPAPEELVQEMRRRYEVIGGSPLLDISRRQASALGRELGLPCAIAMRLSPPWAEDVGVQLCRAGAEGLVLLPLAPFSVAVYAAAAEAALPGVATLRVPAWGARPDVVAAQAARIQPHLGRSGGEHVLLTAHSLPRQVIAQGDAYAHLFEQSADAIGSALAVPFSRCYQSQGASGGEWLGPGLREELERLAASGVRRVVVAPVGFFAEHIETLYDLDIEARALAASLGLDFERVPAVDDDPAFVRALANLVRDTLEEAA
jgi:ferrochelatase